MVVPGPTSSIPGALSILSTPPDPPLLLCPPPSSRQRAALPVILREGRRVVGQAKGTKYVCGSRGDARRSEGTVKAYCAAVRCQPASAQARTGVAAGGEERVCMCVRAHARCPAQPDERQGGGSIGGNLWRWRLAVLGTLQKRTRRPQHRRPWAPPRLLPRARHPRPPPHRPHAGPCPRPRRACLRLPAGRQCAALPTRRQHDAPQALPPPSASRCRRRICCACALPAACASSVRAPPCSGRRGATTRASAGARSPSPP